jgi:WD40 repeat protein
LDGTLRVHELERANRQRVLAGHGGWVNTVALDRDTRRVFSGSADRTLRRWTVDENVPPLTVALDGSVISLAVAPQYGCVLAGDIVGNVYCFRVCDGCSER